MYYRTEAYNLKKPDNAEFFLNLAQTCTKRSEWTLTSGIPSNVFIDIDEIILKPKESKGLVEKMIETVRNITIQGYEFNKLGFIDKTDGTVGLISLMASILNETSLPGIIIRPRKRLIQDKVKGEINKGDRVLLISDLATSGITIFSAAEIIYLYEATVPYSLVVIDRVQGATENLARKGIKLFSLVSLESLNEIKIDDKYEINTPVFQDFGGVSVTYAR